MKNPEANNLLLFEEIPKKAINSDLEERDSQGGRKIEDKTPTGRKEGFENVCDEGTILVQRTLRSGQRLSYEGNIVIMGDVNPGAEVIAENNVVVLGSLRGIVHAGATGNEKAIVAAFNLRPTQLRIAGYVTRAPDHYDQDDDQPEIALLQDGNVVIERYRPGMMRNCD